MLKRLRFLLFPFSVLYYLVTGVRNWLYDVGYLKFIMFNVPVISVGNLSVGGTGKTPFVEYLVGVLGEKHKIGILSRGYKRKTKGYVFADENASAMTIGDEPFQYYEKFKDTVSVAVCEDRVLGVPGLLKDSPDTNLVILDDAYQHRPIRPHCNVLLSDYNRPFYNDFLLPAGNLRESRTGVDRADVLVITKCPADLGEKERERIEKLVAWYHRHLRVFYTTVDYGEPTPVFGGAYNTFSNVLLVSGIANAKPLEAYIKKHYKLKKHMNHSDHYRYSPGDARRIVEAFNAIEGDNKAIITTEKDMVKWKDEGIASVLKGLPVYYLPIKTKFLQDEHYFVDMVNNRIQI